MTLTVLLADIQSVGNEGDWEVKALLLLLNDREHAIELHEAIVQLGA